MKKMITFFPVTLLVALIFMASSPKEVAAPTTDTYILIAWNELGMHCSNKIFANLCILPPYNNHTAHVILRGTSTTPPQVMGPTSGISVTYEIPGNTYSVGKTDFWTYAFHIFGVNLPPNVGLTGYGLTGTMADSNNFFHVQGIPITPFTDDDLVNENPYQLTLIKAYNSSSQLLATTQSVIPVSNEINCVSAGCHTSEMAILQAHEDVTGFNINDRPIYCAGCHADPILGTTGNGEAPKFSQAIHSKHGEFITTDCYKCHPGPNAQCFRDTMHTAGFWCTNCHGNVANVGHSVQMGRIPWMEEPSCGDVMCHGPIFAEEPGKLFKFSKGHGNLMCSTCHGSPHAIFPTTLPNDNLQNITLQGFRGTLRKCDVCHGYTPSAPGPHGITVGINPLTQTIPSRDELLPNYPNPFSYLTNIPFNISTSGQVTLSLYNMDGKLVESILDRYMSPGEYKVETYATKLQSGTYLCALEMNGHKQLRKVIVVK